MRLFRASVPVQREPVRPVLGAQVIDPGSSLFRMLTVELAGGQPVVWGWDEQPGASDVGIDRWFLLGVCEEGRARAAAMARQRARRPVSAKHLVVGLPAWQLRGSVRRTSEQRPRPDRPVDERELTELFRKALRATIVRLSTPDPEGWALVDAVPAGLSIDGRGVTDPVGFRGSELSATVFAAVARLDTIRTWQQLARDLKYTTLTLTAAPLALIAGQSEPLGLMIDVGGSTTGLIWWHSGRPLSVASVPVGGSSWTHALRRRWGLTRDKAEQLKRAYAAGELNPEAETQVHGTLAPVAEEWAKQVEQALVEMSEATGQTLPRQLTLLGGGSLVPDVEPAVRELIRSAQLPFDRYPDVGRLLPAEIHGVINRTSCRPSAADLSALALAAWVGRENWPPDKPGRLLASLSQA